MSNAITRGGGTIHVVGQAYDIQEMNNIGLSFASGTDSIRLRIDVPAELQTTVKNRKASYKIGLWDPDSLQWDTLTNSVVSADGKMVSAAVPHFSRYALVSTGGSLGVTKFTLTPNPFSPYITPTAEFQSRLGGTVPAGGCFEFMLDSDKPTLKSVQLRVYTVTGDMVYSMVLRAPSKEQEYYLWWNGKTTDGQKVWDGIEGSAIATSKMCRNGRYFAVLTATDLGGKEKNSMLPLVILK
jgi:hypothetical protein